MSNTAEPHPEYLTFEDFLVEFDIPRSTFTRWRRLGKPVPRFRRMPNGQLRTTRAEVAAWFDALPECYGDEAA